MFPETFFKLLRKWENRIYLCWYVGQNNQKLRGFKIEISRKEHRKFQKIQRQKLHGVPVCIQLFENVYASYFFLWLDG